MIDVIILRYGLPKYENQCIKKVIETVDGEKTPYHLTVYDNYEADHHISAAWNMLIERSDADHICLLNSDTVPWKNWLEKLMEVFEEKPNVGAVGPVTNNTSGPQGGHEGPTEEKQILPSNQLTGFCLIFPKKVWEEAGKFDERFHIYGEENDFLERVKMKGYQPYFRTDAFVYHYGRKTMDTVACKRKDIEGLTKQSHELYRKKKRQYKKK